MSVSFYTIPQPRCTCGLVTGNYYKYFYRSVKKGTKAVDVLTEMGLNKMCCRRTFLCLTHFPIIDESVNYTDEINGVTRKEDEITPGLVINSPIV